MSMNVSLLRESFAAVAPHAPIVADHFYHELFTRYPEARELFAGIDMEKQKKALIASLVHIVEYIEDDEHLPDYLKKMGARHLKYGVKQEHFSWVADSFLATLNYFLDSEWTPELQETWTEALTIIGTEMMRGMGIQPEQTKAESKPVVKSHPHSAVEDIIKGLAADLLRKALEETLQSEELTTQVKTQVQELVRKLLTEEAHEIASSFSKN